MEVLVIDLKILPYLDFPLTPLGLRETSYVPLVVAIRQILVIIIAAKIKDFEEVPLRSALREMFLKSKPTEIGLSSAKDAFLGYVAACSYFIKGELHVVLRSLQGHLPCFLYVMEACLDVY